MITQQLELPLWLEEVTDILLARLPTKKNGSATYPNREEFEADLIEYIPKCTNLVRVRWDFCLYIIDQLIKLDTSIKKCETTFPYGKELPANAQRGTKLSYLTTLIPTNLRYRLSPIELLVEAFKAWELLAGETYNNKLWWLYHGIYAYDEEEMYKEYAYVLIKRLKLNAPQN